MKWTPKQFARAKKFIERATTNTAGYAAAAAALGTTATAVRLKHERGAFDVHRKPDESTLKEALAKYDLALARQAESSRIKTLERDLHSMKSIMETLAAVTSQPLEPIARRELGSGLREATAIAGLSDVHCEEIVRPGETPVRNEYNPQIADRSIARFFAGYRWLIDFHRQAFSIRDALLWIGGDLMSGHIHEELKESTATPPIKTILWLLPRLKAGIDSLLDDQKIELLTIVCSYGNHGRNTKKPYRARGAEHNFEWLLYQILADSYAGNPRVRFLADPSAHQYVKAYDFDLHFHHGDETNYNGGSGGVTIPLNKSVSQWDKAKHCHYHHFGHWHQYIDMGRYVVNGSVIGYNAYAMSIKAEPEPPQQFFYLLDSKRGKTCKSPIWVRDSSDLKSQKLAS
jgi:hypothetical protein